LEVSLNFRPTDGGYFESDCLLPTDSTKMKERPTRRRIGETIATVAGKKSKDSILERI
jgi:hypothetical protein